MTMTMVRRNKEATISLASARVDAGCPSMWRQTLKEVIWLKGA
jgi:hypothetical protein